MDLSIVIVNWNTRDLLAGCLDSLPAACAGLSVETLVVDNASADGSAAMVQERFPDVRLIDGGGNLGFSRGNNLALPWTRGDQVLLLNPDTVCPPGSLVRLAEFARSRPDLGAVGPLLTDARGEPTRSYGYFPAARFHWLEALDPWRLLPGERQRHRVTRVPRRDEPSAVVEYVFGACFLIPRRALEAVGPLDERFFMYFEETDWCLRARRAGFAVWYCADTEIVHLEGRAAELVSLFSLRQFQASLRLFVAKHYGPRAVARFRAAQWLEYSLKAAGRSLRGGARNQRLAALYREKARLQLMKEIRVSPPA